MGITYTDFDLSVFQFSPIPICTYCCTNKLRQFRHEGFVFVDYVCMQRVCLYPKYLQRFLMDFNENKWTSTIKWRASSILKKIGTVLYDVIWNMTTQTERDISIVWFHLIFYQSFAFRDCFLVFYIIFFLPRISVRQTTTE